MRKNQSVFNFLGNKKSNKWSVDTVRKFKNSIFNGHSNKNMLISKSSAKTKDSWQNGVKGNFFYVRLVWLSRQTNKNTKQSTKKEKSRSCEKKKSEKSKAQNAAETTKNSVIKTEKEINDAGVEKSGKIFPTESPATYD